MNSIAELCGYYIALLRTAYNVHQQSHWKEKGANFYGNHLLFERLYTNSAKDADAAAEKMIGVFGEETLDLSMQAQLIGKMMAKYSTSSPLENSLAVEKAILAFSDKIYEDLKNEDKLTLGTDDFLMTIASNREEAVYLLQQAMKGGSKTAARKTILTKIASAQQGDPTQILHQKLLTWLTATIISYVQGQYNTGDITVEVDLANKRIFGNVRVPKAITPDLQTKIENAFRAQVKQLMGDLTGFTVGVGFAYFPKHASTKHNRLTDWWETISAKNKLPPAPGHVIDARWVMRNDDWYVQTKEGWYWLRSGTWVKAPNGPLY
jgi:DNA-binding ferritin-like protein